MRGVDGRGSAIKARDFANELVACPEIDWISITDNAGGNPQLAPLVMGRPILICRQGSGHSSDLQGSEPEWAGERSLDAEQRRLQQHSGHDRRLSGGGQRGAGRPVFDIDSIGLISLLEQDEPGARREAAANGKKPATGKTQFCIGAVTTNFKLREGEVIPQYAKLEKKVECGAQFIINQIGFDSRKISRAARLHGCARDEGDAADRQCLSAEPARRTNLFHEGRIPGVVVSDALLELCRKQARSPTAARHFSRIRGQADCHLSRAGISRRVSRRRAQSGGD